MNDPTPLFTKTFDFITWLIPITNNFPRGQRFLATQRLLKAAFDFQELTLEANISLPPARLEKLRQADGALDKVRIYLRLALKWEWLKPGQYQHAAAMVTEIGRLLGGWQKVLRQPAARA
jgi:hypothetical protein